MKIRIRNILFLAALQDLLVLIACVASAASFNAWLIVRRAEPSFRP